MRIIAGKMRGRQLKTVEGMQTRPTSDKVKGCYFLMFLGGIRSWMRAY